MDPRAFATSRLTLRRPINSDENCESPQRGIAVLAKVDGLETRRLIGRHPEGVQVGVALEYPVVHAAGNES